MVGGGEGSGQAAGLPDVTYIDALRTDYMILNGWHVCLCYVSWLMC